VGSVRVNFARVVTAFPIFAAVALATRGAGAISGLTGPGAAWLLVSALSSYALADSVFFTAARHIGVTTALSIASLYPLWAALWGAVVSGEPFGLGRVAGTCLAVSGIVWLVRLAGGRDPASAVPGGKKTLGLVLAILASFFWAANSISVKRGAMGLELPQVNAIRYGMAIFLLAPQVAKAEAARRTAWRDYVPLLPAVFFDAVIGSVCYVYGLSHTDLAVGATLSSLAPLVSVPVALALGDEDWNLRRLGAIVTTVSGVVLLVATGR
jgi:drug/metabolite transporter (DMT)-like permease